MRLELNGDSKTAVITGGSSGIGLAVARRLSGLGYSLLLIARNPERLDAAISSLLAARPEGNCRSLSLDIAGLRAAGFDDADAAVEAALEGMPPVKLLVNGAGAAFPGIIEGRDPELIERTINLNFTGHALFTRLILLRFTAGGSIINISSMGGLFPIFGLADYGGAKRGLILFSDALRSELKPRGISVHVLCPPDTDTPGFANENLTKPAETDKISGLAGLWSPERVAEILLRGLKRDKFLILPDLRAKFQVLVARLFPGLIRVLFDSDIKSIQKQGKNNG
jgi:3-dehydrosphinganine reductase